VESATALLWITHPDSVEYKEMATTLSSINNRLERCTQKIGQVFSNSPLHEIGAKLECLISETFEGVGCGVCSLEDAKIMISFIENNISVLPNSFKDRFKFDSALIMVITDNWRHGDVKISPMIVPKYGNTWGFRRIPLEPQKDNPGHVVELIIFPGEDDLEEVNLLLYPWLCHELGHYLLSVYEPHFDVTFSTPLNDFLNRLQIRGIADRGSSKAKSQSMIENIRQYWEPKQDHFDWAHEIAFDTIALWTTGPAFLFAYQHVLQTRKPNPYELSKNHPPYFVRTRAIIEAAKELGWDNYTGELDGTLRDLSLSDRNFRQTNEFVSLAPAHLITDCVNAALDTCNKIRLPKFDRSRLGKIQDNFKHEEFTDFGIDLFSTAWLIYRDGDFQFFSEWENRTIEKLNGYVML